MREETDIFTMLFPINTEHLWGIGNYFFQNNSTFVALLGKRLYPNLIYGCHSGFRRRKK